jgi:hypothetical protein
MQQAVAIAIRLDDGHQAGSGGLSRHMEIILQRA